MERETGIEPATNGLEGRDSTTELLPLVPVGIGVGVVLPGPRDYHLGNPEGEGSGEPADTSELRDRPRWLEWPPPSLF